LLAIKIGSSATGSNYHDVYDGWSALIKSFKWEKLFEVSVYDVLIPIGIGYLIISFIFATVATVVVYMIAQQIKIKKIKANIDKNRHHTQSQKIIGV
jgi:uncharacterized protein (DUF2062 family)